MKKLFALVLAVAMVLSLASVAMANSFGTTNNAVLVEDADGKLQVQYDDVNFYRWVDGAWVVNNGTTPYGKTIYIKLLDANGDPVTKNDAVSGLKVSAKWTQNGKYVKSVEIAKKGGIYCIAINTQGSDNKQKDVVGTITVTGKGYVAATGTDYKADKKYSTKKTEIDVELNLKFPAASEGDVVPESGAFYEYSDWDGDEEDEFTFEADDDVTFTVDTTHQGDIVLAMDCDEIEAVQDAYPSANLDFFNFNGATFRKTGTLLIPAEEGQYIYEYKNGALQAVSAKYDTFEEAFSIKTKTLGQYVISDVELAVGAAVAPAEAAAPAAVAANPSTGAAL